MKMKTKNVTVVAMLVILLTTGIGEAYTWITLDFPGATGTVANGIDGNYIVGEYSDGSHNYGFVYDGTNWTVLDYPGAIHTQATGIDDGLIVGGYIDTSGEYGYIYNGTTWTRLAYSGASNSPALGIDGGNIVGEYITNTRHGFLYDGTTWTTLDFPGAYQTELRGIDGTNIVGSYNFYSGLIYDGTTWTTLNFPGAYRTVAMDIDGSCIVGYYRDSSENRGFLYDGTSWIKLDFPDAAATSAFGIDGGNIVGRYRDSSGKYHGFLYTPDTPASQIQEILDFVDESVGDGTLVGVGPGNSADNRLVAVMNMLEEAHDLIEDEWFAQACHQLRDVLKKCDGQNPPPDTVTGSSAAELAEKISKLMDEICEDTMFAPVEVMTWVPAGYAEDCLDLVKEDFGACGPKDGLTRVGLQFWIPTTDGEIEYVSGLTDGHVGEWREWCHLNGIKCLLCVYNYIAADKIWDWDLARNAFRDKQQVFIQNLVDEMNALNLDGIDVDLEGLDPAILPIDRHAFKQFILNLSIEVHNSGDKILTVDTFSQTSNAPNIDWWPDWVWAVNNIHSLGFDAIGDDDLHEGGTGLQKYSTQQAIGYLSGYDRDVVLMGMPAWKSSWGTSSGRGTSALAHVQEVHYDLPEPTGIAIWSLEHLLPIESAWRDSNLWCEIKELKGDD